MRFRFLISAKNYIVTKIFALRDFLLRNYPVPVRIGNFNIEVDRKHALPRYLRERPTYAANLPRLAELVYQKYSDMIFIDVGANVGDTVAFLRTKFYCPIVCIEGDDFFYGYLQKNITQFKNVYGFKNFLADVSETIGAQKKLVGGTMSIVKSDGEGSLVSTVTLDDFFVAHPEFLQKAKMMKVDTDGYDLKVLRGGMNYIKKVLPILFFEYDRFFLTRAGEDGLSIFRTLKDAGYHRILFFDNIGRFLVAGDVQNERMINELYHYTYRRNGAIPFYDVCVFPATDDDIAEAFSGNELARYDEDSL